MSTFPFESFIELIRFDQETKKMGRNIDKSQKDLAQLIKQKTEIQHEIDQLKAEEHTAQKLVDATELDMKTLEDRERDIKHKIDALQNPKEYSSLKKELDSIHGTQNEVEESLVNVWNQLETAQRVGSQKVTELQDKLTESDEAIITKEKEIKSLQEQQHQHEQERSGKMKSIPEEWLEKYEMMYKRVDNPVVEVEQGSCSGCFYPVPFQDLAKLKRRALLQCNSCYRFLYDPEVLKQPAHEIES